jgi:putative oxidoreductase
MRRWMYNPRLNGWESLGLLLLRLTVGAAFIIHGWPKMQHPTMWMGPDAGVPALMQALAAGTEFGGGAALILGFLTRLAALGLAGVMITALALVHFPSGHPFVAMGGPSFELPAVYLASMACFLFSGPGRFSMDAMIFGMPLQPFANQFGAAGRP